MTLPNAIIAGAPKCGTTTLFRWLSDHPQVVTSFEKETYYLLDEDHPQLRPHVNYHTRGISGYHSLFPVADGGVVLESTPQYIYQQTALQVLPTFAEPPRIVVILRKPAERVYSSYQFTRNNLSDLHGGVSFARYLELAKHDRAELSRLAPQTHFVLGNELMYSRYVDYVSAWLAHYPQGRLHVALFEDLKSDPKIFMERLCTFLGIDARFYDRYAFVSKNETMRIRNQFWHRRVLRLGKFVAGTGLRKFLKTIYLRAQRDDTPVPQEDKAALAALAEEYREPNRELAELLKVDLSLWE